MTNDQYIKALKQALKSLDSDSRDNIISEIQSYTNEPNAGSLEDRFGTPAELAKRYLEDANNTAVAEPKRGISSKVLSVIGGATIVIGLALFLTYRFFARDEYNYADTAKAEEYFAQQQWQRKDVSTLSNIVIKQSRVAIYWRDIDSVRLACPESINTELLVANEFTINKSRCTIQLPKSAANITLNQSDLILVEPMADLTINGEQSRIRIAERDNRYNYVISQTEGNTSQLQSDETAKISITMNIQQSEALPY